MNVWMLYQASEPIRLSRRSRVACACACSSVYNMYGVTPLVWKHVIIEQYDMLLSYCEWTLLILGEVKGRLGQYRAKFEADTW